MNYKAILFDLDGVICSTDALHYLAWKQLADQLSIPFDRRINERLMGTSRMACLDVILEQYQGPALSPEEKHALAEQKNAWYRERLRKMTPADLSDDVRTTLQALRQRGLKLAIGSSSKNTPLILERLGLADFFDAVADGNQISRAKPDPEVYLTAAALVGEPPEGCLVVEDARSGVQAARAAGMAVACVGSAAAAGAGDYNLRSFSQLLGVVDN